MYKEAACTVHVYVYTVYMHIYIYLSRSRTYIELIRPENVKQTMLKYFCLIMGENSLQVTSVGNQCEDRNVPFQTHITLCCPFRWTDAVMILKWYFYVCIELKAKN